MTSHEAGQGKSRGTNKGWLRALLGAGMVLSLGAPLAMAQPAPDHGPDGGPGGPSAHGPIGHRPPPPPPHRWHWRHHHRVPY